jgi:hypothetical protein
VAEISIDENKAARLIAQVLRDEQKVVPDRANELARMICTRMIASMVTPTSPTLSRYRMISPWPSSLNPEWTARLEDLGVDPDLASDIWESVYECGRDLPPHVSDQNPYRVKGDES